MVSFPLIAVLGPALKADISFALGSGQIMCSLQSAGRRSRPLGARMIHCRPFALSRDIHPWRFGRSGMVLTKTTRPVVTVLTVGALAGCASGPQLCRTGTSA